VRDSLDGGAIHVEHGFSPAERPTIALINRGHSGTRLRRGLGSSGWSWDGPLSVLWTRCRGLDSRATISRLRPLKQKTQPNGIDPKTGKPHEPIEIPVPKRDDIERLLKRAAHKKPGKR
jgi:hypothetical protein